MNDKRATGIPAVRRRVSRANARGFRHSLASRSEVDAVGCGHASKTWRRAATIAGVSAGMLMTGAAVPRAFAGTYLMRNCDVPAHSNSLLHPWQQTDNPAPVSMVDACASGGGVGFSFAASRELGGGRSVGINIQKPTGSRSQFTFVKLVLWYAARLTASGQPLYFYSSELRSNGTWYPGLSDAPPGSENLVAEQQLSPDTQAV